MPDLLDSIRGQLRARLDELRPPDPPLQSSGRHGADPREGLGHNREPDAACVPTPDLIHRSAFGVCVPGWASQGAEQQASKR